MTKREELILLADAWQRYADPDVEELVDAILDSLMEPGEGAALAGEYACYAESSPAVPAYRAILTHIKESRDD